MEVTALNDTIRVERRGPIDVLRLNRPERLNAITPELIAALHAYWDERQDDRNCRVVIMTGEGRGFCAGIDLGANREAEATPRTTPEIWVAGRYFSSVVLKMRRAPQPIIAAVNGPAVGAGLSLALAADIRLGSPAARFACSYLNLGLAGGEQGSTFHLVRLIGSANTAEMMYTGRLVDAEEALAMGLISKRVEAGGVLPAAIELAELMCRRASPLGLRLSKETLNEVLGGLALEGTIRFESRNQLLCRDTRDAPEARTAWQEKRDPVWVDG